MNITVGNIEINYEIIGEGKPVLLIHGFMVDHRLMKGCMERAFEGETGYKRIYIDVPGMGLSTCHESIQTADAMLEVLVQFIQQVIGKEKFLIAGQSYGGYLTRGIISKLKEQIEGVAFICPVIIPDFNGRTVPEHVVIQRDKALLNSLTEEQAQDFDENVVIESKEIFDRYQEEVMAGIEIAHQSFLMDYKQKGYAFSFAVDDEIGIYEQPALFILGRQDDCVGYQDALTIIENYPRATISIIDCAGHNVQIEQEKLFTSLIQQWLKRVGNE